MYGSFFIYILQGISAFTSNNTYGIESVKWQSIDLPELKEIKSSDMLVVKAAQNL